MDALEEGEEEGEERSLGHSPVAESERPETTGSIEYRQVQSAPPPSPGAGSPFLEPRFLATAAAVAAVPAVLFFGFQQWRKSQISGGRV